MALDSQRQEQLYWIVFFIKKMWYSSLSDVKGPSKTPDAAALNDPKLGQFKIIKMTMRDASETNNKGVFWSNSEWDMSTEAEQKVKFPKSML